MPDHPTVHLWYPIVGTEPLAHIAGSDVHVHVPTSLAAGVADECGLTSGGSFLGLLALAAGQYSRADAECADLAVEIARALSTLAWESAGRLEVVMHADLGPSESRVTVTAGRPLPPRPNPGFPGVENIPNWQGTTENLRDPIRFTRRLPAIITARAGGRPGWSARRGVDVAGRTIGVASLEKGVHIGWPLVIVGHGGNVVALEAEWGLEDRASGEVAAVRLSPARPRSPRSRPSPEQLLLRRLQRTP